MFDSDGGYIRARYTTALVVPGGKMVGMQRGTQGFKLSFLPNVYSATHVIGSVPFGDPHCA